MDEIRMHNAMYLLKIGTNGFNEEDLEDLLIGNRFGAALFNYSDSNRQAAASELWVMDLKEGFCIPVLVSNPCKDLRYRLYEHLIGNRVPSSELVKNHLIRVVDQGWIRRIVKLEEQIHQCGQSLTINYLAGKTNKDELFRFYMTYNGFYYPQEALRIEDTPKNLHF